MKKLYTTLTVCGMALTTLMFGQSDKELSTLTLTNAQKQSILSEVKPFTPVANENRGSLICDSLTVFTTAGNSFSGNMFDVVPSTNLFLETFSVSVDAGTWNIAIFYKTGTFVGSESASTGWTFLDSAMVTSTTTGAGAFYKVPVLLNLPLTSGTTYGFYVTATDAGATFNYTNGTAVGNTAASNADLTVKEGNGGSYPFSVTFSPRVFNGQVFYCKNTAGIEENSLSTVSMYPNPTSNLVNMDLSAYNGKQATVAIFNTLGQNLKSSSFTANGVKTLAVDELPAGIYFVQLTVNGKTTTSKLTVK